MPGRRRKYEGCEVCGAELLLYKCKYCGKTFCDDHKAPEKHDCEGMAEYRRQKESGAIVPPMETGRVENTDGHGPSIFYSLYRLGVFTVKLLSVLAVTAAAILALVLVVSYVIANTQSYSFSIPVTNATGQTVTLVDYRNATDPTYDQLVTFLKSDDTIDTPYVYPNYTCADFAKALHDRAEAAGIRCGFVAVEFDNETINYSIYDNGDGTFRPPALPADTGHAIDVFNTTDRGQVYVDASSQAGDSDGTAEDRIDYVQVGQELNGIDIDSARDTSYTFYESYRQAHLDLIDEQRQFYLDQALYNKELNATGGFVTMSLEEEGDALNARAVQLNAEKSRLGPFYFPQGIVKSIEIYW